MKIYALQSKETRYPNVFISASNIGNYLVLAEYEVDITLPTNDEARAVLDAYFEQEKEQRIERLKEELKQLESAA